MLVEFLIPLAGFLVGFVVGMSGMGGGALMTPMLILFADVRPLFAVSTDLVFAAVTKTVGAFQHYRQRTLDLTVAKYLAIGALPAALIGVGSLSFLNFQYGSTVDAFIRTILGFTLFVIAVSILIQSLLRRNMHKNLINTSFSKKTKFLACFLGLVVGFLVSTTSVGSGVLLMPLLILFFPLPPSKLVGTDILLASLLTTLAGSLYIFMGNVDLSLVFLLLIGSIPGVILGSKFNARIPARPLLIIIALILFVSGFLLIFKG